MISPQQQSIGLKNKIGESRFIGKQLLSIQRIPNNPIKIRSSYHNRHHCLVAVSAKIWTPEVAAKIEEISQTCETPCLIYLMEFWEKAENLTQEKIEQLKEKELQLKEKGFDPSERLRRLKISIANSNNTPWNVGVKRSEETKKKIRASLKKRYKEDPSLKQVLSKRMENFTHTEETKAKIKKSLDARYAETRRRRAEEKARRRAEREKQLEEARIKREQEKERIRLERLDRKPYDLIKQNDPEGYKRMMEEKRKKISDSVRERWKDPDYRSRVVESMQRFYKENPIQNPMSEETRRKLSKASKAIWEQRRLNGSNTSTTPSRARQKKEEVIDTAEELMSHLVSTKQQAQVLMETIARLKEVMVHLQNDQQQLQQAQESLKKATEILRNLEKTEKNIKACIAGVLGEDQMQDVEELVRSQIVVQQNNSSSNQKTTKKKQSTPSAKFQNGNGNGVVDGSQSSGFEVRSNNFQGQKFVNGVNRDNGEPDNFQ
eukprot:TRINITY_DN39314_c1_g3_i1.p1 TRINITY_DN39314_c1_g3~~TRINITY_DN39314_c1_g3_i1.p1  ORF type:complete len:490 (-),score=80.90 TRINITY_DN39314_c1_g3_i1:205-1674(-)